MAAILVRQDEIQHNKDEFMLGQQLLRLCGGCGQHGFLAIRRQFPLQGVHKIGLLTHQQDGGARRRLSGELLAQYIDQRACQQGQLDRRGFLDITRRLKNIGEPIRGAGGP